MHIGNLLFLFSFAARDVLKLRILAMFGCVLLTAWFATRQPPVWNGIFWQSGFLVVHVYRVTMLIRERRPVPLTMDEERAQTLVFRSLSTREVARICRAGVWHTAQAGDVLCEQGVKLARLMLLIDGAADVLVDGRRVAGLVPGRFVGEMAFLTGEPTSASVRAEGAARYLAWDHEALRAFLSKNRGLNDVLQRTLGSDLAIKLRAGTTSR
jgi:hypothetical protein